MPIRENLPEYKRQHYLKNRDRERAKRRQYYIEHRQEILARIKANYWQDPEKHRLRSRVYHKRSPRIKTAAFKRQRKNAQLKHKHGIDITEFEAALTRQGGVCAICKEPGAVHPNNGQPILHVDHCHRTGRFRGLLCARCNIGIGMFLDDPIRLAQAATYLQGKDSSSFS